MKTCALFNLLRIPRGANLCVLPGARDDLRNECDVPRHDATTESHVDSTTCCSYDAGLGDAISTAARHDFIVRRRMKGAARQVQRVPCDFIGRRGVVNMNDILSAIKSRLHNAECQEKRSPRCLSRVQVMAQAHRGSRRE